MVVDAAFRAGNALLAVARCKGRSRGRDNNGRGQSRAPGELGERGQPGTKGERGDKGEKGDNGADGMNGSAGEKVLKQ